MEYEGLNEIYYDLLFGIFRNNSLVLFIVLFLKYIRLY